MILIPQDLKGERFTSPHGILLKYHCTHQIIHQKSFFQNDALLFVLEGQKHLSTTNDTFTLQAHECIFIPKGSYTFSNIPLKNSYQALLFFFNEDVLLHQKCTNSHQSFQKTFKPHHTLYEFFHSLNFTLLTQSHFLSLKFQELLLLLLHFHPSPTLAFLKHIHSRSHTLLNQLTSHNYLFESVEEMAHTLKLPPSLFSKRFKNEVGISPKEWLDLQRFSQAKKMLLLSDKNITQIATDLNFGSCAWFIKRFKENYGLTPKQFQKIAKNSYI
ncbi:AraC family transcriptional regulator [Helicobacter pametensis]|uniref:AraC family transcriptional regulator n=1 Tax=Helicobacter pametensis TaxID=95149 RepID=UPI0004B44C9F|nr:AraC family transcriptional regulator [Helicobacter pametensis]